MLTLRLAVLFVHVTAVIVALGGSLFSTFALTPVLAEELEPAARLRVMRRVIRRLGVVVLSALAVLIFTGILNLLYLRAMPIALMVKLVLVAVVTGLALYQYGSVGARIWRLSADGPNPAIPPLQVRFRKIGLTVGALVLVIVYLSLTLTRGAIG
jgi:uncharacterized membrane protein